jgi:hypothetical protein
MTAPWGAGALHQRLNAFVKKSLIQQLVPPGAVVSSPPFLEILILSRFYERVVQSLHELIFFGKKNLCWLAVRIFLMNWAHQSADAMLWLSSSFVGLV